MLKDRYPQIPGVRLDMDDEHNGMIGPAIDLDDRILPNASGVRTAKMWVRESGHGVGKSATLHLTESDLIALRNGINRTLVASGVEREITITVPVKG